MIVVWRITVQLLLKTVPKRPVKNLCHSALKTTEGKTVLKKTSSKETLLLVNFGNKSNQGHFRSGGVFFLPVRRRALGFEAKVSVHHYLMRKAQVGNTVLQLHQTG